MRRLTSGELAQAVPAAMQRLPRWVGHRNKQPQDVVRGGMASTTDERTWGTFGQALEWYDRGEGDGIGFVFTAADGMVFVDLDGALDNEGAVKPWAIPLVSRLTAATYVETSPSTMGLHAFFLGDLPRSPGVTGARVRPEGAEAGDKIEVYAERRFSTVTGWRLGGAREDVGSGEEVLPQLLWETGLGARLLRQSVPASPAGESVTVSEDDLARVKGALDALDPDIGYEDWLSVGMALKAGLGEDGRELWLEWCARGAKHKEGEPESKWRSFRGAGVGLGTLFHKALEAGWDGRQDALAQFQGVEIPAPPAAGVEGGLTGGEEGVPYHIAIFGRGKGQYEAIVRSVANAALYFERDRKWAGRVRLNERTGEVEIDGRPVQDHDLSWLTGDISRALDWTESPASPDLVDKALSAAAQKRRYDPVADWLKGLTWDGQGRIDGFCARVGLEDNEATRRYMRLFLMGAVARALEPGCSMPYVPVLCGPQGAGKSRLAERLAVRKEWYHESAVTLGDKDAYMAIQGPWIVELPELAGVRRNDVEKVKAFVSEKESRFRKPYGRKVVREPRRCVFIATTNEEEYTQDASGARRWLGIGVPGELTLPDPEEIAQLWAEAVEAYRRGDRRYETAEEMAETNARGEERRERGTLEVATEGVLRELTREGATTVEEVLAVLKDRVTLSEHAPRVIQVALRKAGWQRQRVSVGDHVWRVWAVPGADRDTWRSAVDRRRTYVVSDN